MLGLAMAIFVTQPDLYSDWKHWARKMSAINRNFPNPLIYSDFDSWAAQISRTERSIPSPPLYKGYKEWGTRLYGVVNFNG